MRDVPTTKATTRAFLNLLDEKRGFRNKQSREKNRVELRVDFRELFNTESES